MFSQLVKFSPPRMWFCTIANHNTIFRHKTIYIFFLYFNM